MLSKFETRSNRVKGLAFHPKRPWILAALHSGTIQLWDFKMGTLIDRFEEHDGPVRSVAFHPTQPLFVSGGDDCRIKVWNYKQRRCLFTLNGHIDYVRAVSFHNESPWILSCSDDQTVRIWNWQSRNCIAILTGHTHFIMSAQFHPTEDLVASASLDMTIRVWDISGLKKKNTRHSSGLSSALGNAELHLGNLAALGGNVSAAAQSDFFGDGDTMVKFVLEGHFRGVNWVAFHPTLPLLLSVSDDRTIKLWRMSESRAWEVDSCRGHLGNISCAVFHPRQDLILSDSEDKTIRIWDMHRRVVLQTFRREHDRFWILAAHPMMNLFAAGHDSGLLIFKLERERPAQTLHENLLYYIKDRELRCYNFANDTDIAIITVERPGHMALNMPRSISYNPAQHAMIVNAINEEPSYYIYKLPMPIGSSDIQDEPKVVETGFGKSAVFVARNKFAFLDVNEQVIKVRDLQQNSATKEVLLAIPPSGPLVDIFFAGINTLLVSTASSVFTVDTETGAQSSELSVNGVRYTIWNSSMSHVALVSKHTIIIATKSLKQLSLVHETIRIKGGAWEDSGVFVYSTLNHIKYLLPQGDNGLLKGVDQSIYLTKVKGKKVYCLDRDAIVRVINVDPTEYRFKIALAQKSYDAVMHLIQNSNLVGQSIIAYLRKKGYPEVALHFVQNSKTKFNLALECGNLTVAVETANALNIPEAWRKLSVEALKQGNSLIVELCYQKLKDFEKLSFFYLVTGDREKLSKMLTIAEKRKDVMSMYHNSMVLGNVEAQIKVLKDVEQYPLAYLTAKSYGYDQLAEEILELAGIDESQIELPSVAPTPKALQPPKPSKVNANKPWPLPIPVMKDAEDLFSAKRALEPAGSEKKPVTSSLLDTVNDLNADTFADAQSDLSGEQGTEEHTGVNGNQQLPPIVTEGEGWGMDELDIPIVDKVVSPIADEYGSPRNDVSRRMTEVYEGTIRPDGTYVVPSPGISIFDQWTQHSDLAVDHAAAGAFANAGRILNEQIGAINFKSYKTKFMQVYQAARAYVQTIPLTGGLYVPILRNGLVQNPEEMRPYAIFTLRFIQGMLNEAFELTTKGNFNKAQLVFKDILLTCTLAVAANEQEEKALFEAIHTCKEYIVGLRCEILRRTLPEDQIGRSLELSAFFASCKLRPEHSILSLRSAMGAAFKVQNFASAAFFSKRLLELNPPEAFANQARTVHAHCSRQLVDKVACGFKPDTELRLCAVSMSPIGPTEEFFVCGLTGALFKKAFAGKPNPVTMINKIGVAGTGLRVR